MISRMETGLSDCCKAGLYLDNVVKGTLPIDSPARLFTETQSSNCLRDLELICPC